MLRVRSEEPEPHDAEQGLQLPHSETMQWTGQLLSEHCFVSAVCGQSAPPIEGAATVRVRLCKPPSPHVTPEHAPQSVQLPTTQSVTGAQMRSEEAVGTVSSNSA